MWMCCLSLVCALTAAPLEVEGDDTLAYYLSKSDLVIVGTVAEKPGYAVEESGGRIYSAAIEVHEVLKGSLPRTAAKTPAVLKPLIVRIEEERDEELPLLRKGSKCIFFLDKDGAKTVDVWFGVQRHTTALAKSITRLAKRDAAK